MSGQELEPGGGGGAEMVGLDAGRVREGATARPRPQWRRGESLGGRDVKSASLKYAEGLVRLHKTVQERVVISYDLG